MKARGIVQSQRAVGYALATLATMIWAGNYVLARGLHERIPPVSLASWRWALALLILLPFSYRELASQRRIILRHLPYLCLTALLGITLLNTLVYIAGHTTHAIKLSLITASAPVFTLLLAALINKERIARAKGIGVITAISGVLILIFSRSDAANVLVVSWGDLWVLLAAVAFAGYNMLVQRKPAGLGGRAFLFSIFLIGWIFLLPFHIWEHLAAAPWELDLVVATSLIYLAVGASLLAFLAWNRAVALIGPTAAAVIYYLLPVFSSLEAAVLLDERLLPVHIVSFALIVGGIAITDLFKGGGARDANRVQQRI